MVSTTSTRSLLAVNAATVALALALDWPVATLLWPYWIQSIVIGYFSCKRILALGRFSTEGLTMNDRAVSPTVATQRSVASFFSVHYGFFHVVYRAGTPNIGTLMFLPYGRIIPMHLTIIVGGALGGDSAWSVRQRTAATA